MKFLYIVGLLMMNSLTESVANGFDSAYTSGDVIELLKDVPRNAHVFVDIDDTVITPASTTFRAAPFNTLMDEIKQNSGAYPNYTDIVSNWRLQRKVMLLDNNWPQTINTLKEIYSVYGLTKLDSGAFGNIPSMEQWRYNELTSLNIHFTQHADFDEKIIGGASFYKGLFITGVNSKSETLSKFMDDIKATTVVMIDDRQEHLQDIQRLCDKHDIDFKGILYRGLEKLIDKPNPEIAAYQKAHLIKHARWLEDADVQSRLQTS